MDISGEIENSICKYIKFKNIQTNIEVWYSGETICDYLKQGNKLDLIFVDMELSNMNGIEVGNYIRNELDDYNIRIVLISSIINYD